MGWTFHKSVNLGPFRVNLSKSGIGYSVGANNFRVGVNSKGRRYESISIPGTGISYRTSSKARSGSTGCALVLVIAAALVASGVHQIVTWR